MSAYELAEIEQAPSGAGAAARWGRWVLILLAYAVAFTGLRYFASHWATGQLFSLWFPAAGLRFAFLWRFGPRIAPAAALAEFVVQMATGANSLEPSPALAFVGIVGPCLIYGAVIYLVKRHVFRGAPGIGSETLPFALAALVGPFAACLAAMAWALPRATATGIVDLPELLTALLVFALGDMLGIFLVAPPLLWLADAGRTAVWKALRTTRATITEVMTVNVLAWALVLGINASGLGLMMAPILLAVCWTGLRLGRIGAWFFILLAAMLVLPVTGVEGAEGDRIRLHMILACTAAIGFLAGSFAEAEAQFHDEIARRDRMLYQAERLKTLRGMSVALVHEISQPLSTIALEARNLVALANGPPRNREEVLEVAALISRKSDDLTQLVRRLRRFGERSADLPSPIPVALLLADLGDDAAIEAKRRKVRLEVLSQADGAIMGFEIELRQALLNLVRNAIAASPPGGVVLIRSAAVDGRLELSVDNALEDAPSHRAGMGIGLVVARSIAEAHSGSLREERPTSASVRYLLDLPIHGERS